MLMKRLLLSAALSAYAGAVMAQGVPVFDAQAFAKKLEIFRQLERDEDTQVEKANNRAEIRSFQQQQIDTLDQMISAFSSVSTFHTSFIGGGGDSYPGIEQTYGPLTNPAGGVMFGDAREDIESLIVRGSRDTYSHPGVAKAGLSPLQWRCLMQALIWQESRFQIGAKSPKDAFGLTQIIPDTAKGLGIYPDYYNDPYLQVVGGGRYLAQQLDRFDGNIIFALGAYNAGPGRIIEYKGVPPFKETQHYVQVIPAKYNSYLQTIGGAEALGTLDPAEYAVANASLLSTGSMAYGEYNLNTAQQALLRVRGLVEQVGSSATVKDSYDLNTQMKAEILLILLERVKTKAARTQAEAAQVAWLLTKQREAVKALDLTLPAN